MIAQLFLSALGIYLLCGLVFAIPFVLVGAAKLDPHAQKGTWGFRLIIMPGVIALWPMLLRRWLRGVNHPPEECNSHRLKAQPRRQP